MTIPSPQVTVLAHRGRALAVVLTLVQVTAISWLIGELSVQPRVPALVAVVTGTVLLAAVALASAIRTLAGVPWTSLRWITRASACAWLLTPAGIIAAGQVFATGWDFGSCGTIFTPWRPTQPALAEFRKQCDTAFTQRLTYVAVAAGAAVALATGYGLWLRYRSHLSPRNRG